MVDVAVFWNEYERLVEPKFIASERSFQFVNLTRARIRGAEATLEGALRNDLVGFRLGYTYLDARDLDLDQPLVFRSEHLFVGALSVEPLDRLEFGLDYRFASKPEGVDSDFTLFVPDASVFVPTHVLDARVGVRLGRIRTAVLVKNALDYYYLERAALLAKPRHFVLQVQADL